MISVRRAVPFLITVWVLLLAGCHSSVRFEAHAPYNSPRRFPAPLIIVHPDDMDTVRTTANVGRFLQPRKFRVYHGEALIWESVARFGGMFTGVFLVRESDYDSLNEGVSEENEDQFTVPESLRGEVGYVLRLSRVRFSFEGNRASYLVDVAFMNRQSGEELFRGTMRGRSTPMTVKTDTRLMIREAQQTVVMANTSLLNPLAERMLRAIEEQPPIPARSATAPQSSEEVSVEPTEPSQPEEPPHPRLRPFFVSPE